MRYDYWQLLRVIAAKKDGTPVLVEPNVSNIAPHITVISGVKTGNRGRFGLWDLTIMVMDDYGNEKEHNYSYRVVENAKYCENGNLTFE